MTFNEYAELVGRAYLWPLELVTYEKLDSAISKQQKMLQTSMPAKATCNIHEDCAKAPADKHCYRLDCEGC